MDDVMNFMPACFFVFYIIGCWKSKNYVTSTSICFYWLRTIIVIFLLFTFTISSLLGVALSKKNIQEMSKDCFLPFAVLGCFFKSLNIVGSRDTITYIIQTLINDPCLPRNPKEILIQKKFDKFIWYVCF